jgi:predicted transcriptional regulator of viral defense system
MEILMDYNQFKNKFQNSPVILSREVVQQEGDCQNIHNQLNRWLKKGLIIKLKKGIYLLNKNDRRGNPDQVFLANQLYGPSYVSLEFALNLYGLIPERVAEVTSISTKKTARFSNEFGEYSYQHIKPEAFRGFRSVKDSNGFCSFIAEPEKAIVDFLYLNLYRLKPGDRDVFTESYRFQNVEDLRLKRFINLSKLFNNRKLLKVAETFCDWVKSEG